MPTERSSRFGQGFTLLELLLVLAVVGLIAAMATLSVGTGPRPYQIEAAANEFVGIAEYALNEAQMTGTDLGVLVRPAGGDRYSYQWMQRIGQTWQEPRLQDDAFDERYLPVEVDVVLEIEEEELEADDEEREDGTPPPPQIVFFASGEAIPGIMTWIDASTGEVLWELEWDLLGRFEMRRGGISEDDENE